MHSKKLCVLVCKDEVYNTTFYHLTPHGLTEWTVLNNIAITTTSGVPNRRVQGSTHGLIVVVVVLCSLSIG